MENTREKVAIVATALRQAGVICHLFGGWAEDILGVRAPSTHGDIDLLYCGKDFQAFDRALHDHPDFQEVPQKRFRHKRAFRFLGTVSELTLVQGPEERPTNPVLGGRSLRVGKPSPLWVSRRNLR